MTDLNAPVVRRIARAVALTPAVLALAAAPAFADTPEKWADPEPVSTLHVLVVLLFIPLGLFLLISLLVFVPSMARGERYTPGRAWHNENEWFGGPRGGVEAADKAGPETAEAAERADRGGASAHW
ncbi:MAG TPA: hypothetical protein VFG63_10135 [Nocardioidaceae bacterium]|nr:hypothetical protein [Nocardioidaceae bacterium]